MTNRECINIRVFLWEGTHVFEMPVHNPKTTLSSHATFTLSNVNILSLKKTTTLNDDPILRFCGCWGLFPVYPTDLLKPFNN